MKTSYIAVIAIVIVAVAGVGVYFAFFNNGGSDGLDVDVVKDTVVAGDYVEYDMSVSGVKTSEEDIYALEFIGQVFSLPEGATPAGTEKITYKGVTIECEKYVYESDLVSMTYLAKYGAVYKIISDLDGLLSTSTLDDTSLDLTTPEQEISKGSFIKMTNTAVVKMMGTEINLATTSTITITGYDSEEDTYSAKLDIKMTGTGVLKLKVTSVSGDNLIIEGMDAPVPKSTFYSILDVEKFREYAKTMGTVVEGQKIDKGTVKVFDGDRKITQQEIKVISEDEGTMSLNVEYGQKGALYVVSVPQDENTYAILTLKGTSMFQKA